MLIGIVMTILVLVGILALNIFQFRKYLILLNDEKFIEKLKRINILKSLIASMLMMSVIYILNIYFLNQKSQPYKMALMTQLNDIGYSPSIKIYNKEYHAI